MTSRNKFTSPVINELKYYVYIYSNPITNEIFYIGKGKGNRVFSHLNDQKENKKVQYISDLRKLGLKPKIEILIHGLDDDESALRVESSVIDMIGIHKLTNKQNGYKSATFGRMTIKQINALYDRQNINIDEPAILIRINQAFRYSMAEAELYDYTRGQWKINPNRAKHAEYGIAVYEGIIQEVYKIDSWHEAGTTLSTRLENENIKRGPLERIHGRYEFIGNLAPENIRKKYNHKSVEHYFKKGNSNPIMYVNL